MDLLALATTDGQLSLARLDWNKQGGERENKLWTSNPDSPVTSLGWRPDGKVLASGHADGSVQLHHIEDGEVLHASKPHAAAVTSLHWQEAPAADAAQSSCAHQSVVARFTLPTHGGGGGSGGVLGGTGKAGAGKAGGAAAGGGGGGGGGGGAKKDAGTAGGGGAGSRTLLDHFNPPTRLTVLCSGDADGAVVLSAFGIFPVGSADLAAARLLLPDDAASSGGNIAVQHASLSPDLSRVLVAFSSSSSSSSSASSTTASSSSHAATASVPLLAARSREVCQIAAGLSSSLHTILVHIRSTASTRIFIFCIFHPSSPVHL